MKKMGRPKLNHRQYRMSISFSETAWKILSLIQDGKKSEWISKLIETYAFKKPKK